MACADLARRQLLPPRPFAERREAIVGGGRASKSRILGEAIGERLNRNRAGALDVFGPEEGR